MTQFSKSNPGQRLRNLATRCDFSDTVGPTLSKIIRKGEVEITLQTFFSMTPY